MKVYTYSEARGKLATLLKEAQKEGEVHIHRRDGQKFVLKPLATTSSPLDVPGVDVGITTSELMEIISDSHRRA